MGHLGAYAILAVALFGHQVFWFFLALIKKRNDVADVAWGLGFVLISWLGYALGDGGASALLVNTLVSIWGARLALHIHFRQRGKAEDFRYAQWRKEWRHFHLRSFFQVFVFQGSLLFVIAWPVMWLNLATPQGWQIWDVLGTTVWLIGFAFEFVADNQLARFKRNHHNSGKLITHGLWRYSRHPNYFGEAVQWWGIFLIACSTGGWFTVVSPLLITFLLRYVSGVPMLERKYADRTDFKEYAKKTSVFFPLPPRGQ